MSHANTGTNVQNYGEMNELSKRLTYSFILENINSISLSSAFATSKGFLKSWKKKGEKKNFQVGEWG